VKNKNLHSNYFSLPHFIRLTLKIKVKNLFPLSFILIKDAILINPKKKVNCIRANRQIIFGRKVHIFQSNHGLDFAITLTFSVSIVQLSFLVLRVVPFTVVI